MDFTEIKDFVRTHADTDEFDAPDASLEVYARAAYNDIRRRLGNWDEFHGEDILTVTAGTVSYQLTSAAFTNQNLELVTSVVGETRTLAYIPWDGYLQMREGTTTTSNTREADYWTVKDGTVYLYPDPSVTSVQYTVYGFQVFTEWPSGSTASPLPREFDEPICWYMLAKYYQAQEDLELSQILMGDFERSVNRMLAFAQRKDAHRPKKFGGARRFGVGYGDWVRRNTEG